MRYIIFRLLLENVELIDSFIEGIKLYHVIEFRVELTMNINIITFYIKT